MVYSRVAPAQPVAPAAGCVPSPDRVRYEILPVACTGEQIVALVRQSAAEASVPGWWDELPPGRHPTQVVVEALARELDEVFDQSRSVVHSTSWRYEGEYLVLSYLAALPPLADAPHGFVLRPVRTRAAQPGRTGDPGAIPVMEVVAHGLRHLAMLRISDPTVATTLARRWHELLACWNPLPAGLLDHCLPASGAATGTPAAAAP